MSISIGWLIGITLFLVYSFYRMQSAHLRQIGRQAQQLNKLENRCLELEAQRDHEKELKDRAWNQLQAIKVAYRKHEDLENYFD